MSTLTAAEHDRLVEIMMVELAEEGRLHEVDDGDITVEEYFELEDYGIENEPGYSESTQPYLW